jgi:hypothetical protein
MMDAGTSADGVRRLPQIWKNVVHMGAIKLKECGFTLDNKVISEL